MEDTDFISEVPFSSLNLSDPFFDSLRADYKGFNYWFSKKADQGKKAIVSFDKGKNVHAFLYLKPEVAEEVDHTIDPLLPQVSKLKVGTFKIEAHHSALGQRFMTIILRQMIISHAALTYVTMFDNKYPNLANLFKKFGFNYWGKKDGETVYCKDLANKNDIYFDFPRISAVTSRKYLFGIYPKFHTKLFPDSRLCSERNYKRVDITSSNSIEKIYICNLKGVPFLKKGDLLVIYRTTDRPGEAKYRSVVTSVCTFVEMKNIHSFVNFADFKKYIKGDSVFTEAELKDYFETQRYTYVVKMLYNFPLNKRITQGNLTSKAGINADYWGFWPINDNQFKKILELGKANESFIIDKTEIC